MANAPPRNTAGRLRAKSSTSLTSSLASLSLRYSESRSVCSAAWFTYRATESCSCSCSCCPVVRRARATPPSSLEARSFWVASWPTAFSRPCSAYSEAFCWATSCVWPSCEPLWLDSRCRLSRSDPSSDQSSSEPPVLRSCGPPMNILLSARLLEHEPCSPFIHPILVVLTEPKGPPHPSACGDLWQPVPGLL